MRSNQVLRFSFMTTPIKEFVSFILKGVDLIDHTSIFLLRTINHYVTLCVSENILLGVRYLVSVEG